MRDPSPQRGDRYNYAGSFLFSEENRKPEAVFYFLSLVPPRAYFTLLFHARGKEAEKETEREREKEHSLHRSLTLDIGASVPLGIRREAGWNPTNRE